MGCDIHSRCEVFNPVTNTWETMGEIFPLEEFGQKYSKRDCSVEPFGNRNYGMFGFLAGVRNMAECKPLSYPRGLPPDSPNSGWEDGGYLGDHSFSWFLLSELLAFDYSQKFPNRRHNEIETYADLVGEEFFKSLEILKTLGPPEHVRLLFGFDS